MASRLAVIIPTLDEAERIRASLEALAPLRAKGHEVIVVDGGSSDSTIERARPLVDQVLSSARGRAMQMNAGARAARAETLVFLHADTRLPALADALIINALRVYAWGRFDVQIEGAHPLLGLVACAMNLRSRLTGIATGDQAIFVRRDMFVDFPEIPLMEDIAFSRAMKRVGAPACLRDRVTTSGRRWEARGVLRTIFLMWRLRLLYALGVEPQRLARDYADQR
ncbi:MAG TPA: TIGR04283 family arsenosugar biosynthesis glycosyltransferase [Burkholderiales bacterium]|nr:TIGR04283 family arsenosugar biosynthesis glycosyltransferase [Burkholderiales bacterium]